MTTPTQPPAPAVERMSDETFLYVTNTLGAATYATNHEQPYRMLETEARRAREREDVLMVEHDLRQHEAFKLREQLSAALKERDEARAKMPPGADTIFARGLATGRAERDALRVRCEKLERAAEGALNYFDTALMCGNDLSDVAEPLRRALRDEPGEHARKWLAADTSGPGALAWGGEPEGKEDGT